MDNAMIEKVARAICTAHGLDPNEPVSTGDGQTDTVYEARTHGPAYHSMAWDEPRWRTFRRAASEAIAAKIAMEALT